MNIALILAGGKATRLNGADKGLVDINGKPLVSYVFDALLNDKNIDKIFVSTNQNHAIYRSLFNNILSDDEDFYHHGPLAGLLSLEGLVNKDDVVQLISCDTPIIPTDLFLQLKKAREKSHAKVAYPIINGRQHYTLLQMAVADCFECIRELLKKDERRVRSFLTLQKAVPLEIQMPEDLLNANTLDDIKKLREKLK